MKTPNNKALAMYGVTEEDFLKWCEGRKLSPYKKSTKTLFFSKLAQGKLVKDKFTGKLLVKKPRNK